jgi:hypothetical protein
MSDLPPSTCKHVYGRNDQVLAQLKAGFHTILGPEVRDSCAILSSRSRLAVWKKSSNAGPDGAGISTLNAILAAIVHGRVPAVPDPGRGRRLQPGMLLPGGRQLALRPAGCTQGLHGHRQERPACRVSDNGLELTSMTILRWSPATRVD